jgi:hypothetical protein
LQVDIPLRGTARARRAVPSGIARVGCGCMDMGFLLFSSMRWSLFSISYSFPIPLWPFANNLLMGLYLLIVEYLFLPEP